MDQAELQHLIDKVNSGNASEEELALYGRYIDWISSGNANWDQETLGAEDVFKNELLHLIDSEIKAGQQAKQLWSRKNSALWYSLAGSIAACLLIVIFFYQKQTKTPAAEKKDAYTTAIGKKMKITLPDGTLVILNGGSKLVLAQNYNQKSRNVLLDGEAYFVVRHNVQKEFSVSVGHVTIHDIGTTFNVKAYQADGVIETSLIEGKIAITTSDNAASKITLKPNEKLVWNERDDLKIESAKIDYVVKALTRYTAGDSTTAETDWTQDKLTFNNESLAQMASKLERWYGVKVQIQNSADKRNRFTATFKNESVENVLMALKEAGNFNFRKEGDIINIY